MRGVPRVGLCLAENRKAQSWAHSTGSALGTRRGVEEQAGRGCREGRREGGGVTKEASARREKINQVGTAEARPGRALGRADGIS